MSEKLYFHKYNKYKKKYLELKMKGGEWHKQIMEVESPSFASYKEELDKNKHCTVHFARGDMHCKSAGNNKCGSFNSVCECKATKEIKEMYDRFKKWYSVPENRHTSQLADTNFCTF